MKLKMPRMGGLPMPEASLPKVPGAPASPKSTSPMKVGEQATVKMPKSKKMADATDKPSVFYKAETAIKKPSIENLKAFLENSKQKKQSSHSNERLSMDHDKKISAKDAAIAVLKKAQEMLEADKLAKASKHVSANAFGTQNEKGVHTSKWSDNPGESDTGIYARSAKGNKGIQAGKTDLDHTKEEHKRVLGEIKAMPKPDLGKAEQDATPPDGVKAQAPAPDNFNGNPAPGAEPKNLGENYKGHIKLAKFVGRMEAKREAKKAPAAAPAELAKATGHETGVHKPVSDKKWGAGMSHAGSDAASGKGFLDRAKSGESPTPSMSAASGKKKIDEAKASHAKVLGEIKDAPKPKLPG